MDKMFDGGYIVVALTTAQHIALDQAGANIRQVPETTGRFFIAPMARAKGTKTFAIPVADVRKL